MADLTVRTSTLTAHSGRGGAALSSSAQTAAEPASPDRFEQEAPTVDPSSALRRAAQSAPAKSTARFNPWLYPTYEAARLAQKISFGGLSMGLSIQSAMLNIQSSMLGLVDPMGLFTTPLKLGASVAAASSEMASRFVRDYNKPAFNLTQTTIAGKVVAVEPEVVADKTFGALLHFKRDVNRNDPKLLIVAPMSGHYATLLRDTVSAMLPNHDVYITDWKNARDIPVSKGNFGLDDYISYVKDFIKTVGPQANVLSICQSTVESLAAVASLAAEKSPYQPLTMTLMGGPLDTRAASTQVTELAQKKPLSWFENNLIGMVPASYKGSGRRVYPGFMQLGAFIAMHPEKHLQSHQDLFNFLVNHNTAKAHKIENFYDEYESVSDLDAKFYLETVQRIFIDAQLAQGTFTYNGNLIKPGDIKNTALLTVEGENDDISAPGQTTAAHKMCSGLRADQKYHYLEPGAGHYGIFSGHGWRDDIAPRITGFIRAAAQKNGVQYDDASNALQPERFVSSN